MMYGQIAGRLRSMLMFAIRTSGCSFCTTHVGQRLFPLLYTQ
jgi:hypothetical protein